MNLTKDWHIHSKYSWCGHPGATVERVYSQAKATGLKEFGLSDHLHTSINLPHLIAARREFDILESDPSFHFGLELSCIRETDIQNDENAGKNPPHGIRSLDQDDLPALFLSDPVLQSLRPEYLIGGVHWAFGGGGDRTSVIKSYFRQYLFLLEHPLIDIIAHPWWLEDDRWVSPDGKYWGFPWFDDFNVIPQSVHQEFAAAARENHVAVEINPDATFMYDKYSEKFQKQYFEYLWMLREMGVIFSVGTDQHSDGYTPRLTAYEPYLDRLEVTQDDLWDISQSKILNASLTI